MEPDTDLQMTPARPETDDKEESLDDGLELSSHVVGANQDLLLEILIHLPVRSLVRFKSVSKNLLSLINTPRFRKRKNERFRKDISGILMKRSHSQVRSNPKFDFVPLQSQSLRSSPLRTLNFVNDEWGLDVLQSCNGLLLLQNSLFVKYVDRKYFVYNPSTKEYRTISLSRVLNSGEVVTPRAVHLAFDPRKSPHYKLICGYRKDIPFGRYDFGARYELAIYSSESGVVRNLGIDMQWIEAEHSRGLYWNGAINWIDLWKDGLYFNVDKECLGSFPMPPVPAFVDEMDEIWGVRRLRYYGESNDHLHFIQMNTLPIDFDVYEMDKAYSGWLKKFHVDLLPVLTAFPDSYDDYIPDLDGDYYLCGALAVVRKDDDDDSFIVLSVPGRAIRLNLKDNTFTTFCELDEVYGCKDSIQFIESLSSV